MKYCEFITVYLAMKFTVLTPRNRKNRNKIRTELMVHTHTHTHIDTQQADNLAYWKKVGCANVKDMIDKIYLW